MLIKAITLFRLRAVGDFLFAFCSLINIDEAPVCHFKTNFKTKSWHTSDFLPTVLVHLRQTVFKWILSKPAVCTYFVCIWSFGHARSSKCALLVSFRACRAVTHTHFSLGNSVSCVDCTFNVLLSNMSRETRSHHNRGMCANTYELHYCLSRDCSPLGLELMGKLRTLLTVFTLIRKLKLVIMERGVTFLTRACGVRPITMLCVSWPIRADCACLK